MLQRRYIEYRQHSLLRFGGLEEVLDSFQAVWAAEDVDVVEMGGQHVLRAQGLDETLQERSDSD